MAASRLVLWFRGRNLLTFAVRAQSVSGDYTFGQGVSNFLRDTPAAVAQVVGTRLRLWEGEFFLDLSDGTPYWQTILAHKNYGLASDAVRQRILTTPFLISIDDYSAVFTDDTREFLVTGTLNTAFGVVPVAFPLKFGSPGGPFEAGSSPSGPGGGGLG